MKILYVDIQYDYGLKERGLNTIAHDGFLRAFKNLGTTIDTFFYDSYLNGNNDQLQIDLLEKVENFKPDFTFFVIFRDHFKPETLEKLKQKTQTINWFGDDTWRFDDFVKKYAPHFTYVVSADKYAALRYKKELGIHPIVSQWAAIEVPINSEVKYEFDVSFVGGAHPVRKWFVHELSKRGIKVDCFGHGWSNGAVSSERMYEIFRNSKINLNLSNSKTYDYRFLTSSLKNFYVGIRSNKVAPQIKARNFEIPYAGGFQLTEYVPGIEEYYELGKELICFKDVDETTTLIKYYLSQDEERIDIAKRGFSKTANNHTYSQRLKIIFEAIRNRKNG